VGLVVLFAFLAVTFLLLAAGEFTAILAYVQFPPFNECRDTDHTSQSYQSWWCAGPHHCIRRLLHRLERPSRRRQCQVARWKFQLIG